MSRLYTRHVITNMDESRVQQCVICGDVICDYSNASWPSGQKAPSGWVAGDIYVSSGQPIIITKVILDFEETEDCEPSKSGLL